MNNKFINVLDVLKNASNECLNNDKPMLYSDDFSLYESMSAVVIMDEKMDPCYDLSCTTFKDHILKCYDQCGPSDDTKAELLLHELVRREVAFLDGASLLESLHHGLHMWPDAWDALEKSSSSSDKWILTYCQSIVASNTIFHQLVMNADIYEDEDFQFSSKMSTNMTCDEMKDVHKRTDYLSMPGNDEISLTKSCRLLFRYRTLLFQLLEKCDTLISASLNLPLSTRTNNSSPLQVNAMWKKLESQGESALDESNSLLKESLKSVYRVSYELHLLVSEIASLTDTEGITLESASGDQKEFISNSFSKSLMNLQQTSPARNFPLLSYKESLRYLQDMCEDLLCVCSSLNNMLFQTENIDIDTLLQWFMAFSRNKSNVLVRSYLVAVWNFAKPYVKLFLLNSCDSRGNGYSFKFWLSF